MKKGIFIVLLAAVMSASLVQINPKVGRAGTFNRDYWPTDDWVFINPEEMGMDALLIENLNEYLVEEGVGLDGLVVIKNGYLVLNKYYRGWSEDMEHSIYSCTKSITSAAVGIAIDKGYFTVDDYVLDFFPNRTFENVNDRKRNLTVKNLLQMQAGFDWDEWSLDYGHPDNDHTAMQRSDDYVQFILDKPMTYNPGTVFTYCGGASHLLSAIVQLSVNMTTWDFLNLYLFEPIGINPGSHLTSPDNVFFGAHGLTLIPLDMARFGFLYLNNGTWDGKQIISKSWVLDSTRNYYHIGERLGVSIQYGYQWWIFNQTYGYFDFQAVGYAGQKIHCFPELDLIVVFTSSADVNRDPILNDFIIPAIVGKPKSSITIDLGVGLIAMLSLITLKRRIPLKRKR